MKWIDVDLGCVHCFENFHQSFEKLVDRPMWVLFEFTQEASAKLFEQRISQIGAPASF